MEKERFFCFLVTTLYSLYTPCHDLAFAKEDILVLINGYSGFMITLLQRLALLREANEFP